jgi:hypothetical protein
MPVASPDGAAAVNGMQGFTRGGGRRKKARVTPARAALATTVMAAAIGCAEIAEYDVQPTRVCAGESVTLRWKATGAVTIDATPPLPGLGARPSEGSASVAVPQDTRFVLTAKRAFGSKQREWDVVALPNAAPKPFGGLADCDDSARAATVSFALGPPQISEGLRALEVANPYDRTLVVSKDAVKATLAAKASTAAFAQAPARGAWTIEAPLGAGETCDQALDALAQRLVAMFTMSCGS